MGQDAAHPAICQAVGNRRQTNSLTSDLLLVIVMAYTFLPYARQSETVIPRSDAESRTHQHVKCNRLHTLDSASERGMTNTDRLA